jgi:circadian clock protein KaiC
VSANTRLGTNAVIFKTEPVSQVGKALTGVEGLDEITLGGLPRGRATLIVGGPGSGKTTLALQTLVNGARLWDEPGIFIAFEENSRGIIANADQFGWKLPALQRKKLFFLDAQPKPDLIQAGGFDLSGMLAALTAKVTEVGARRIVFDSLDRLLDLLADPLAERREVYRLHEWLLEKELTAIITAKSYGEKASTPDQQSYGFMQFMMDCALGLNHDMVQGVSQRSLRVLKYRGSSFSENDSPFVIGKHGFEVAGSLGAKGKIAKVTTERLSSGVERFDTMLGGGYYRGAGVLITGSPGTAKTTLSGAFAQAACLRGERTVFISFDSDSADIIRNLASVDIRLLRFQRKGLLHLVSARSGESSAEVHFMRIKAMVREHKARNLIIDPISALANQGNEFTAHNVLERLTDWVKTEGLTLFCTSLLDSASPEMESTRLQISTIADTWIHLSYLVRGGERNRALTIVKSRGTAHSNQVRELILRPDGITLADAYTAGGEVLMGTMRWEKEQSVLAEHLLKQTEVRRKLEELELADVELTGRIHALGRDLAAKRAERQLLKEAESQHQKLLVQSSSDMGGMRGLDTDPRALKSGPT